jgi:hypothetical protein
MFHLPCCARQSSGSYPAFLFLTRLRESELARKPDMGKLSRSDRTWVQLARIPEAVNERRDTKSCCCRHTVPVQQASLAETFVLARVSFPPFPSRSLTREQKVKKMENHHSGGGVNKHETPKGYDDQLQTACRYADSLRYIAH